jgi:adenylylsulfate kinase
MRRGKRLVPVVWFTGLSGSGKSTIASGVASKLRRRGFAVQVLDGDIVRTTLGKDLGFSREDRCESLRRISYVAGLLTAHKVVVLVAAISPYSAVREEIRRNHTHFIEVFVNAPLEVCEERDPKGLYRKARAGIIQNFTGISDPYESPERPDIECRTDKENVETSCARVVEAVERTVSQNRIFIHSQQHPAGFRPVPATSKKLR